MARVPYISVTLRRRLSAMYVPGESKQAHKEETRRLRAEYKKDLVLQGYTKKEAHKMSLSICTYKDKIFCSNTLKSYFKAVDSFQHFCAETLGTKRITLEEAATHVQEYVNWCIEKEMTPPTIKTYLSGVCKAMALNISDYQKPEIHYADAIRGVLPAKNDIYNATHAANALRANRIIGLRRNELCTLALRDIHFFEDRVEVYTIGKGKKSNVNVITDPNEIAELKSMVKEAEEKGQTFLLSKSETRNDADLHHERALKAISVYEKTVEDMTKHPERRAYYQSEIKRIFDENGKTLYENLDNPYRCRGENKKKLISMGKNTVFDRTAVLYVSCTITNHFRCDTTVQHYLIK